MKQCRWVQRELPGNDADKCEDHSSALSYHIWYIATFRYNLFSAFGEFYNYAMR